MTPGLTPRASATAPRTTALRLWVTAGLGLAAAAVSLAATPTTDPLQRYLQAHQADPSQMAPRYLIGPPSSGPRAQASTDSSGAPTSVPNTVPNWSTTITSPLDHVTYTVSMVGSSPYDTTKVNTAVTYVPIAVRLHFPNKVVFDPTKLANCDTSSPATRFFNSPIFKAATYTSNGVNVSTAVTGGTQLESAFQRANFWNAVKGTQYGVTLKPSTTTTKVVDYTVTTGTVVGVSSQCKPGVMNPFGEMSLNEYDALVQSLANQYATPTEIPVVLAYNVVLTDGGCCIIGYHNAVSVAAGTQLYAVGTYVDPGIFSGISDIGAWSHELGELIDDPFVQSIPGAPGGYANDLTPSWGHLGQVPGCQNNLEVGDPLTGSQYAISGGGGFVYHYQDLVFHDWFYRTPSTSTGGAGSFKDLLAGGGQPTLCS